MKRSAALLLVGGALPVLLRMDPERAHDWGLKSLRMMQALWPETVVSARLAVHCLGMQFAHPLGLAAGFDKNGDYLDALGAMGFGHVELGTVTPRPQPGNPKPRMFRIAAHDALVNRMGFNNKGVDHLVAQLAASRYAGVRGVSIGKNFDTPLENAQDDYVTCLRKVYACADYVAVNVSSPNTARLRELQSRDGLERIVGALQEERARLEVQHGKRLPLLVKIAPNLDCEQLAALAGTLVALQVDGVIATNTSTDLSLLGDSWPAEQRGGLSGAPVHALSVAVIAQLRAELGVRFPILGVGGIVSAAHASATLQAGANLIQVYTGFAYKGPGLVQEILDALTAQLHN